MKFSWKEWMLVLAAIALMALLHRLDLLAIVAPLSLFVSYGLSRIGTASRSVRRRI